MYNIGNAEAKIQISNISGILLCLIELDPFYVVEKAKIQLLPSKDLRKFDHVLRIVPVEDVVNTELDEIIITATDIALRKIYEKEQQQRQQEPSSLPRLISPVQQEKEKTEERQQEEEQLPSIDYMTSR